MKRKDIVKKNGIILKKKMMTKEDKKWRMIMENAMKETNNEQREIYVCFIK